ncbi:M14 family metallopeptidase [Galbibacter mesophilus]|uniref:M14 family metallopeptidase n=1 Tax=Galbibacter mesophilus TaxID=379069 RepID=UPI00191E1382|nr:M14 family metallopeptidase [Galbibacter mesophilus]MCM5663810.1 M14 family metallopeptidase [Galbibacter mesophilus]
MKLRFLLLSLFLTLFSFAQNVKSPSEFLGYELGSNFSRHHQVVDYYKYLAATLPGMIKLESYGTTNEGRELLLAYVSTSENINNLKSIQDNHMAAISGEGASETAVVWLSYNVHGNESVSTEASLMTIYDLVTSKKELLENTLVIVDPCLNPDGRDRYVNFYNGFKNSPYTVDKNSKEHHEPWLAGRPNHYMFDLNRDWAWATQKESQQRLKVYNQWLPHIHVDFHEQGMDDPYYFPPAAEPMHELITDWQKEFQKEIGKNHATYFDENGWFYFTKERFDLLYPSYGDTYPTYNGAIGMTYEQGGSGRAGLGVKVSNGDTLTLKDRIAHHYTTGISTVEMAAKNVEKLNEQFKKFYGNKDFTYKSYAMSGDEEKMKSLAKLLDVHNIQYGYTKSGVKGLSYTDKKSGSLDGDNYKLVVSTNQPKSTLVTVLFEPETKLSDSLTYDITAWSLPYAYGLDAVASKSLINTSEKTLPNESTTLNTNGYAFVTDWNGMDDARFLTELLKENIKVRYSHEPFELNGKSFDHGSLIITKSDNTNKKEFVNILEKAAKENGQQITSVATGFVDSGKDFGSSSVEMIAPVKVAALSGGSVSTLNFGEVWHFFEQQLQYPITVLDDEYFDRIDLAEYDVLILPQLYTISDARMETIKSWVRNGGKLIAIGNAVSVLDKDKAFGVEAKKLEEKAKDSLNMPKSYALSSREYISNLITGAIYKTKVDVTNPLAYGYNDTYFTLKLSGDGYGFLDSENAVYMEEEQTPIAGFAGANAQKLQSNSMIFGTEDFGRGKVVYMVDNPIFRGFWENGKLFFVNAVFMVK